jgi:ribonucleoside-diphosphate reductase alpha chain
MTTAKTPRNPKSAATPRGLRIERRFTQAGTDPFNSFTWVHRLSRIGSIDGTAVFEMPNVEVPDFWDQVAVDILASKYFRKTGVPQYDADGALLLDDEGLALLGPERSLKQTALRLARAWRTWGERAGYFATPADAAAYQDEMAYMLCAQMAAPNSPAWFNVGIFEAYGIIQDPDGSWYFDPVDGVAKQSSHRYEHVGANACFINRVEDQLVGDGSIFDYIEREARLFSQGSGSGANLSLIRAEGEKLTAGGTSSGVISFMKVADTAAGAIKSGGATRRAAKMVILDADHPEIEAFIWSKAHEEKKAAALIAAGYEAGYEGEAVRSVAFQNANHSVRINPGFMQAVIDDAEWHLTARRDGSVMKTVRARDIWRQIAQAAWECADPGLQFDDILNDWNTAADTERLRGTNPCSEYTHVDDTACNLASLNLVKFYDDTKATFDTEAFEFAARLWTITLEIQVVMSHYPARVIAEKSFQHRTLGLGYANLGALLMRAGLAYDSDEARAVVGAITALMHNRAYATSAELAATAGPCEAWSPNRHAMARVLANHRRAAYGNHPDAPSCAGDYQGLSVTPVGVDHVMLAATPFANLGPAVLAAADAAQHAPNGYRNMQVTVLAPTGTIGLVMSCDTTGVEPDFALVKMKKLAGGGYMRIINSSVTPALIRLGYKPAQIDRILAYALGTQTFKGASAVSASSLKAAGLSELAIERAEAALANVSDLTWAFARHVVGEPAYAKLPEAADGFDLLVSLGFKPAQIAESNATICGHLTLEGAPDLSPEHVPVFDCAVECGDGTRSIAWSGHVGALAAVAPHISGSASKTVNLPNSASVEDLEAVHQTAYEWGVKCIAIYRDGSKVAQPLSSAKADAEVESATEETPAFSLPTPEPGQSPRQAYGNHPVPRFRPPNPRFGPTWRLEIGGEEVYVKVNTYSDGSPAEVFIDWGSQGSTLRGMTAALSIAISHALQRGMPLEDLVRAFRNQTFEPNGVVRGHENLKMTSSVVDAVARILGYFFLGRDDLVQVPGGLTAKDVAFGTQLFVPDDDVDTEQARSITPGELVAPAASTAETDKAKAIIAAGGGQRMFGKTCSSCGSGNLIQAGACAVCGDCGTTTGCS